MIKGARIEREFLTAGLNGELLNTVKKSEDRRLEMRRKYACYFNSGEPESDEVGVVADFFESLQGSDVFDIERKSLRARGKGCDPPDCEALLVDGRRIGIEVTELVDQDSLRYQCSDPTHTVRPYAYTRETFLLRLQARLNAKVRSEAALNGGPYNILVLLVFTDELLLSYEEVQFWLDEKEFEMPEPWDQIYLLFSYSPKFAENQNDSVRGLPYCRIR